MNPNVWNIKELLSIPPASGGAQKCSGRSGAASDYSSLTDSQFLFGSQLRPEHHQGLSQDSNLHKNFQTSSQEMTESRVSAKYNSKPLLFGTDSQEMSCKVKGMLERFEEDKRKAKRTHESDQLSSRVLQLCDCIENMKITLLNITENTESAKGSIMEHLRGLTNAVQDNIASLKECVHPQLEDLQCKLASQIQRLRGIEDREKKVAWEMSTLHSRVKELQRVLETKQSKEQCMMADILSILGALKPSPMPVVPTTEGATQTSPRLFRKLFLVSKETRYREGVQMQGRSIQSPPQKASPHVKKTSRRQKSLRRVSRPQTLYKSRAECEGGVESCVQPATISYTKDTSPWLVSNYSQTAQVIEKRRSLWQLFSISDDSDDQE